MHNHCQIGWGGGGGGGVEGGGGVSRDGGREEDMVLDIILDEEHLP